MGALTIKPLAFKARPWELNNREIINFIDSYCGQITIQKRGNEIIRILPTRKDSYYWINDRVRFFFESLKKQRITYPYLLLKNKYLKINWQLGVLFFKYFKYMIESIDEINNIQEQLKIKKINIYKNIIINKNISETDLISNILLNKFLLTRNLIKYDSINFKGNINANFYSESLFNEIKKIKYNIVNNINMINDYPRIWLLIKNSKILLIGIKKNLKFLSFILNNTNNEIFKLKKSKSILGFFKNESLLYTEQLISGIEIPQVILNKNTEEFNKLWINNKNNNYCINKNTYLNWSFLKDKKTKLSEQGININFFTHGIEKNEGFNIIYPITTFLEEYSLRLDTYGVIQKSIPVNIRGINMRNMAQILFLINNLFENKKKTEIDFKLLKDILLLKYGIITEEYKNIKNEFIYNYITRTNKLNLLENIREHALFKHSNVLQIKESFEKKKNNY